MKWITRKNVKVDRVACPWLIRRFVDPQAEFLFVEEERLLGMAEQEHATPFVHSAPVAFFCMLNGMGTDRSTSFAVEQAVIPGLVSDRSRTWALSWYNVALDGSGAIGALSGALPVAIQNWTGVGLIPAYRWVFLFYTALNLVSAGLYLFLDSKVELSVAPELAQAGSSISPGTKRIVGRIAALFTLDAAGGGFLADALLAYWFFHRFGVNEKALGLLFFIVRLLNGLSHLGAAWLARRIGLVRTMVFTHLPSSVFLLLVPLATKFQVAAALLFLREALVEMDVPTRQSYVAAVVQPHERVYASGVTNVTRTGAAAFARRRHEGDLRPAAVPLFPACKAAEERQHHTELRNQLSSNRSLQFTKGRSS